MKSNLNNELEWKRSPFEMRTTTNFYDESISK